MDSQYSLKRRLAPSASAAWLKALHNVFWQGQMVSPRGRETWEDTGYTCLVDMSQPVVAVANRQLSYRFMAAEALWILAGDATVAGIAPYNSRISEFSDNGTSFFGAYGPRVVDQMSYVVNKLSEDRDTRQAVMTTWRQNPSPSKDIPCTIALAFNIRHDALYCHAFMRSSDIWLGLPYDIFNFSMIAAKVACRLNASRPTETPVGLGELAITAVSSHLYLTNVDDAKSVVKDPIVEIAMPVPSESISSGNWHEIETSLLACREKQTHGVWLVRPSTERRQEPST